MTSKNRLAIGSGESFHGEDWEHLDIVDTEPVDTVHDLEIGELPYEDNQFKEIRALNVLEHLSQESYLNIMEEIMRVGEPGARVVISGPHYLSHNTPASDHYRGFSKISMNVFKEDHTYPTPVKQGFKRVEVSYKWNEALWTHRLRMIVPDKLLKKYVPNTVDEIHFDIRLSDEKGGD